MADEDRPMNRRRFFREGLAELLKPLGKSIAPLTRLAEEVGKLDQPMAPTPAPGTYYTPLNTAARGSTPVGPVNNDLVFLRPPGAVAESAFLDTCSRCGHCEQACPVHAIQIDWNSGIAGGGPYIDAETQPCTMCDGLFCMKQCPSGALRELLEATDIDMGTAQWRPNTCLRSAGQPCTDCIDHCPIGNIAIELKNNEIHVKEDGCTGCGCCQHACPSVPKSIVVIPRKEEPTD